MRECACVCVCEHGSMCECVHECVGMSESTKKPLHLLVCPWHYMSKSWRKDLKLNGISCISICTQCTNWTNTMTQVLHQCIIKSAQTNQSNVGFNACKLIACFVIGWMVAKCPSSMLVYLRDRSAQTILCSATLNCRSSTLPQAVTVYWHRTNQSQHWSYNARRLAG